MDPGGRGQQQAAPVWVLLGHKAGDNSQVLALAEALELPFVAKRMAYRPTEIWTNLLLGPNLLGIRAACRGQLRPPWPRLVITAGRRNEPVARWIRARAPEPVRLVHVGRPWAGPGSFDLVITTPQYRIADRPNVLSFELPLHRISEARLAGAAAAWRERLGGLPAPRIAVLVGGDSGRYRLGETAAQMLGRRADALARELGGSLLVTTSARTPPGAAAAIRRALTVPHYLFEWQPDGEENPYLAFLALGDRFVVTSESMSMLAEACATRKPVHIFDVGEAGRHGGLRAMPGRVLAGLRYRALTHRLGQRLGPRRMRRDISRLHDALIASGRAVWLGEPFPAGPPPPLPDAGEAARAVRALLATDRDREDRGGRGPTG